MLKFLKKNKTQENNVSSETSLDDLPPAPMPNSGNAPNIKSDEPYIPPIPEDNNIDNNPVGNQELEPLPESPKLPETKPKVEEPHEELQEPKAISEEKNKLDLSNLNAEDLKPVSPKDIDPRDHFDDLIKPNSELPASDPEPNSIFGDTSKPEIPALNPETPKQENSSSPELSKDYFDSYNSENLELPSTEELAQVLKPKTLESPVLSKTPEENLELPKMPETKSVLPSFESVQEQKAVSPPSQGFTDKFDLPEVFYSALPDKELAIYVSVNDYALVTQNMKKLLKFFKSAGKLLGQADNPEKVHVINELYKELNTAQQNLMNIDKKLFERDGNGA